MTLARLVNSKLFKMAAGEKFWERRILFFAGNYYSTYHKQSTNIGGHAYLNKTALGHSRLLGCVGFSISHNLRTRDVVSKEKKGS